MKRVAIVLTLLFACSVIAFAQTEAPKEEAKGGKPAPEKSGEEPKGEPEKKPEEKPAGEVEWLSSLDEAKKLAKEKGLKIIVLFTNPDRCPPCRMLDSRTIPQEEVQKFLKGFVLLKVNAWTSQGRPLERQFGVRSIPTIVMLDSGGKEIGRFSGYRDAQSFISVLTDLRDADTYIAEGEKMSKESPDTVSYTHLTLPTN